MNRTRKTIAYGDRIFARVTRNGRTILNFVTEQVSDMTELIAELRKAMKDLSGLVMIHIRNYHKGWGDERPLLLYNRSNRMLFPWEVH
ncbi:MAG: hypothetical protein J1E78_04035 [Muribaculaceae bacterium]|nr:hypothetical protein [Muribaculaceae bacterium]